MVVVPLSAPVRPLPPPRRPKDSPRMPKELSRTSQGPPKDLPWLTNTISFVVVSFFKLLKTLLAPSGLNHAINTNGISSISKSTFFSCWTLFASRKRPKIDPLTHKENPRDPKVAPRITQEAPKAPTKDPRGSQGPPRTSPRVLKDPRETPRRPKDPPGIQRGSQGFRI